MNKIFYIKSVCRISVLIGLCMIISQAILGQETSLTVISNTKGVPSEMKLSELKSVMKGEKQRWSDGTKVSIALMKTTTPVGQVTCKKIYNMSGDKVLKFWLQLSFDFKAPYHIFFNSAAEMEQFISQNPGAIGITDKATTSEGIKLVVIDGKNSF